MAVAVGFARFSGFRSVRTSYIKSQKQRGLFSEYIAQTDSKDVSKHLLKSKGFQFLDRYFSKEQKKHLGMAFAYAYPKVREEAKEKAKWTFTLNSAFYFSSETLI